MTYLPTMTTGGLPEDSPANEISQSTAEITPDPVKMDEIAPKVIEALKTVYDPEIPVNIFEMGLIYDVIVDASRPGRREDDADRAGVSCRAVVAGRSARQGAQRRGRDRRESRSRLGSALDEGPHVGCGEVTARNAVAARPTLFASGVTHQCDPSGRSLAGPASPRRRSRVSRPLSTPHPAPVRCCLAPVVAAAPTLKTPCRKPGCAPFEVSRGSAASPHSRPG